LHFIRYYRTMPDVRSSSQLGTTKVSGIWCCWSQTRVFTIQSKSSSS